jgi:hypothetical protein
VRDFASPDHLISFGSAETDHPGNLTDAIKHRFCIAVAFSLSAPNFN